MENEREEKNVTTTTTFVRGGSEVATSGNGVRNRWQWRSRAAVMEFYGAMFVLSLGFLIVHSSLYKNMIWVVLAALGHARLKKFRV